MMDDYGNQYRYAGYWHDVLEEEFMDDYGYPLYVPVLDTWVWA